MEANLVAWIGAFPYLAVVLLLAACGVGAPLSEELVALTAGVVAARGGASLVGVMAAAFVGVLAGDVLLYRLGRTVGVRATGHPRLARVLTPPRVERARRLFARHGARAVFAARFLPGVRAPTFLMAGSCGLPFRRFLLADALGALVLAPLYTWLGWRFGHVVLRDLRGALRVVLMVAVAAGAAWVLARWVRAARARRAEAAG